VMMYLLRVPGGRKQAGRVDAADEKPINDAPQFLGDGEHAAGKGGEGGATEGGDQRERQKRRRKERRGACRDEMRNGE
jgi:hypothetical protein